MLLRLLPPFSIFHQPLLIPFCDLKVWPASWYLNCSSYKLATNGVPEIELLVDGELLDWIMAQSDSAIETSWAATDQSMHVGV